MENDAAWTKWINKLHEFELNEEKLSLPTNAIMSILHLNLL